MCERERRRKKCVQGVIKCVIFAICISSSEKANTGVEASLLHTRTRNAHAHIKRPRAQTHGSVLLRQKLDLSGGIRPEETEPVHIHVQV